MRNLKYIFHILLLSVSTANAGLIDCSGLPKSHTVTVNIVNASTGASVVSGAATTERAGTSDSNYYYSFAAEVAGTTYVVECIDGTDALYNFSWTLSARETYVDAAVSTVNTAVGTITAKLPTNYIMGSSVQTAKDDEIDDILTDTGTTIPATLATLMLASSYTAPDNASVAAIKAKTDNLPSDPASNTQVATRASQTSVNAIPTNPTLQTTWTDAKAGYLTGAVALDSTVAKAATVALQATLTTLIPEAIPFTSHKVDANATATVDNAAVADAVWDEALSGHSTAGTAGLALSTASAAGDPWDIALPGSYTTGKAGKIVGDYLNAAVGNRPTLAQIEASTELLRKTSGSTTNLVGVSADNNINANAVIQTSDKTSIAQYVWDSDEVATRKLTSAYTDEASPRDMAATGGTGSGATHVNADTGGTDNLAYKTSGGVGIWGATVKAYLKTDYDAGNTADAYVKGTTTTKIDGTWNSDLMLDAGFTYTIEFYKAGTYGPDTKEVTI